MDNIFLIAVAFVSGAMLVWPLVRRGAGGPSVNTLEATQLINRSRHGDMILPGQSLYVLEVAPAGYAAIAANEAEKAAEINILEVRAFGSFGRVYLGGEERDIDVGYRAAERAIADISGRAAKISGA